MDTVDTAERDALAEEFEQLRKAPGRSPEGSARLAEVRAQLLVLVAVPPAGYEVPRAARQLADHARAHGWGVVEQWIYGPEVEAPFLVVSVTRPAEDEEGREAGKRWWFRYVWHSRDAGPGRVRRFGEGLAETPAFPATHAAPPVKTVRGLISACPMPM